MVTMPEITQEILYHFVKAVVLIEFLHDEEMEAVAHALERAPGVHDLHDVKTFKTLADVVRSYAEGAQ